MKTKTCGTCRFRGNELEVLVDVTLETKGSGYFGCERIKHDKEWEYQKGQLALVTDGSGYHAVLCVEEDFGCLAWEKKKS